MNISDRKISQRTGAGERLYQLRIELGLTLAEAGERWGITPQSLCKYERGTEMLKSRTAVALAEREGVSMDWLYGLSEERARR